MRLINVLPQHSLVDMLPIAPLHAKLTHRKVKNLNKQIIKAETAQAKRRQEKKKRKMEAFNEKKRLEAEEKMKREEPDKYQALKQDDAVDGAVAEYNIMMNQQLAQMQNQVRYYRGQY